MERQPMLLDLKICHCYNDNISLTNLQSQCNSYQNLIASVKTEKLVL